MRQHHSPAAVPLQLQTVERLSVHTPIDHQTPKVVSSASRIRSDLIDPPVRASERGEVSEARRTPPTFQSSGA
jgi:hypothetical protein